MNDLERLLLTIGDLEMQRRVLMDRIKELEAEVTALRNGQVEQADVTAWDEVAKT